MDTVASVLFQYASEQFHVSDSHAEESSRLSGALRRLYNGFNGGYFWNRALLIRPVSRGAGIPVALDDWNNPELWKGLYGTVCRDVLFFAEDAFGVQFGVLDERIVRFDPETADIEDCAATMAEWASLLVDDPAYHTGAPVLAAWEAKHEPIPRSCRLVPKQLFMLGGEFHSANMVCKSDVEGLRIRAQFWELTKDLPDGQMVVFKVDD